MIIESNKMETTSNIVATLSFMHDHQQKVTQAIEKRGNDKTETSSNDMTWLEMPGKTSKPNPAAMESAEMFELSSQ